MIYDFLERYDQAASSKDMVCSTVQGQQLKITKELIHKALEFVGSVDNVSSSNVARLLAIISNGGTRHKSYPVKQCIAAYRPRLIVLMECISIQKKCLYASAALAQTMAATEKAKGQPGWSGFILSNLRRQLTTIHS